MRILNIVEQLNGVVSQILSFPVHEEQLSQDVIQEAESTFKGIISEVMGEIDDETLDSYIEDGNYSDDNGWEVSLVWSETN